MFKVTQVCGKQFEAKDKRKIYCSPACKTEAHRQRHGLEKPDFLKPKESLGGTKKEKKAIEREKTVLVKVDNPEYKTKELEVQKISAEIGMLQKHKEAKLKKYNSLLEKHEPTVGSLIGGFFGAILGGSIGRTTGEKLAFGALGALFFGLIGNNIGKNVRDDKEAKIMKEFEKIKLEIDKIEGEITEKQLQAFFTKSDLSGISKQILVEKVEKYIEYIEVDNLKDLLNDKVAEPIKIGIKKNQGDNAKVMSLDAFKQVKIDTLDVESKSSEFHKVLGNPTGNFRMMIYGENYNGKSTYAVKLADFLSKNFGRVLFNSSEEGLSTSLQNKAKELTSNMLDFSFYKTYNELIKYLKKSDTLKPRFVVIDSVNDMGMSIDDLKELIALDTQRAIIYVMQATKGGTFKGQNDFAHEADIKIKIENYIPIIDKNRYL
jgi:outer membrane lipoprotein SlyB